VKYIGDQIEAVKAKRPSRGVSDLPNFNVDQVRDFKHIFSFLNEKDRDILYLIFVSGKKQQDVQRILSRSQPSLCYDIKRIRKRLRFIFYLHSVFDIFLQFIVQYEEYFTPHELEVLTLMFYTSSFTMTASILDITQVKVRYSFDKCLRKMEEFEMWEVYEMFVVIRSNLNLIKRVYQEYKDDEFMLQDVFIPF